MKKRICEHVLTAHRYWDDWPPMELLGFIGWFQDKLELIPPEHRASAEVEIRDEMQYGDTVVYMEICYWRDETDEEEATRERLAKQAEESERNQELRLLAQLEAKYRTKA